jgi:lipopolysaccharide/colanic/teichoic acid biosynthesis glycosyltransferase
MYAVFKRGFDIAVSLSALVVLCPLFIIIIVAIRLGSKGPAIFKQERAGLNAKPFIFYKFRTMRTEVDPFGASPKSGDDPRITKVGKFLREYSLDELPQLLNILKGDMSVVGPRPLYISQIPEWNQRQRQRLLVKPGLTGLAQISGRAALTREQKLEFDVEYVEKASFLLDIKIVFETTKQAIFRKDIYEKRYSETETTRGENSGEYKQ